MAQRIGDAAKRVFESPRAGVVIAGMEVPHLDSAADRLRVAQRAA